MIHTVNGLIKKEDLGLCFSHEHIVWDEKYATLMYFDRNYDEVYTNDLFNKILPLLKNLYRLGCRAIVEASPPIGGQNLKLMQKLTLASGIHIIPNTGMMFTSKVYEVHPNFSINELVERWVRDYREGLDQIDGITIKPGQIKVLLGDEGGPGFFSMIDQKILRASIRASKITKLPIHCHIMEAKTAAIAFKVLEEEEANYNRFLWAHIGHDEVPDLEVIDYAIKKEMWLGLDQIRPGNYEKYFKLLQELMSRNYSHKILLSQDYEFLEEVNLDGDKHLCSSLITDFIPYCVKRGISASIILDILTINPASFFDVENN